MPGMHFATADQTCIGQADTCAAQPAPVHLAGGEILEVEAPSQPSSTTARSPMPEIFSRFGKGFGNTAFCEKGLFWSPGKIFTPCRSQGWFLPWISTARVPLYCACAVLAQTADRAPKPGCAPGLGLSKQAHDFCCCYPQADQGSCYRNNPVANTRKWKLPPPAPFLQLSSGWAERSNAPRPSQTPPSYRDVTHGLPMTATGLQCPLHHEQHSSLYRGNTATLPGQAVSGMKTQASSQLCRGMGSPTTDGNQTRSLSQE